MLSRAQITPQNNDFKTWSKTFSSNPTAVGKTAGTYGKMGTIKIPNKQEDLYLYGFLVNVVLTISTAGESGFPIMKVESSDIGLINEEFILPRLGSTDVIGTNSKSLVKETVFVPIEVVNKVNNKSFDIYFTSSQTLTADWIGYVSAVFGNKPKNSVPSNYGLEMAMGYKSFLDSLGRYKADAAKAIATAFVEVSLTDITIPAKAKQLVSLEPVILVNAPTADEEICALMIFNAGDISDFGPQEYPCTMSFEASLGTPVGGARNLPSRGYPVRFLLPQTEFGFSAKVKCVLAITNPPDFVHALEFKTFEPK